MATFAEHDQCCSYYSSESNGVALNCFRIATNPQNVFWYARTVKPVVSLEPDTIFICRHNNIIRRKTSVFKPGKFPSFTFSWCYNTPPRTRDRNTGVEGNKRKTAGGRLDMS